MSTLKELADAGHLVEYHPDMEADEMPERWVYFSPSFETWAASVLPMLKRDRGRNLFPNEQVEQTLFDFVKGRPLAYDLKYKKLDPVGNHVWELKTEDVRLIGWFPRPRHFVIVVGEMKVNLKRAADYKPYIENAVNFRTQLDLDEPKSVLGAKREAIL
jgi:hypothetical protein